MSVEHDSLKPWQIFCGLFLSFWVTSAYFDHFLMTAVFCLVFGVVAEIVTKEMYCGSSSNKSGQEEQKMDGKSIEEKMANNEEIWLKAEASLEVDENDDDDVPPPLPDKDYETGKLDTLSAKLQALVDESTKEEGNKTPENESNEKNASECVPAVAREYNRTVSDEYNQNTSILNSNLLSDINNSIIEEEIIDQRPSLEENEELGKQSEQKLYAPDSSDDDDEEDDDDFASREVNFDDSESDDEDFDQYVRNTSQGSNPEDEDSASLAVKNENRLEDQGINNAHKTADKKGSFSGEGNIQKF